MSDLLFKRTLVHAAMLAMVLIIAAIAIVRERR
jgi:hypothetical protein